MCAGGTTCNSGRNLLDFIDANTTKDGRVVVGYADGCVGACAAANGTEAQSTSAYATVAYQSDGKNLFAANDGAPGPSPSATPSISPSASPSASPTASPTGSPSPSPSTSPSASPTPTPTGGTDPDPATPNLTSGVSKSGTNAAAGGYVYYKVSVPSGATNLTLNLTGPACGLISCSPDIDLLTKLGAKPTTASKDASSETGSNTENVSVSNPGAGYWYVGIYTYSGAAGKAFTIKATVS
jgi:hypothetical protein